MSVRFWEQLVLPPPPLHATPPLTWVGREDRVRWVIEHFTEGELARLYEQIHKQGMRYDACRPTYEKERRQLEKPS